MTAGSLFTEDFLSEGIAASPVWAALADGEVAALRQEMRAVFAKVHDPGQLNEAQTQNRIIEPVLALLGWQGIFSVQTNIERRFRPNVSDYTFFADAEAFALADREKHYDSKLKHAVAVADAKQFSIGLDARGGGAGAGETPSGQMMRYLLRAEAVSDRKVRWGVLTNGRNWRLYFGGARSLLEGYYEADLGWLLGLPGMQGELDSGAGTDAAHRFKTFLLAFRREAFQPAAELGGQTFHDYAVAEGRLWETKVRTELSKVVFEDVFPGLIQALAAASGKPLTVAHLAELREAALALLYRLLFALYAEDRDLLPVRDRRFDVYALSKIRDQIASQIDLQDAMSAKATRYWDHCAALFRIIDEGEEGLGIPPYNGGLFAKTHAPLLGALRVNDAAFAPLLDKLSRTLKDGRPVRINFRDLSVRELGAIYEGLLEFEPVVAADGAIAVRPNAFSRKSSGSYYTPDELVKLIIERTVGPLVDERLAAFKARAETLAADNRPAAERLRELEHADPAAKILELKICDPAMGSGHFLVSLIDYLATHVFTAMGEATTQVAWGNYLSPLLGRLAAIRARIAAEAASHRWTVADEQLSDRNLVKRMVLKRCVYGVDKNPMAVELAKVALWLHTFTAGAPLSFLDHHLRCGDSLFGERVRRALDELRAESPLLLNRELQRAQGAIAGMEFVESLTDADIAEVKASSESFHEVEAAIRPLDRFLCFWQAVKWLKPLKASKDIEEDEAGAFSGLMAGSFGDPLAVVSGESEPQPARSGLNAEQVALLERRTGALRRLLDRAQALVGEERFLNWEVAFPGVWRNWQGAELDGGFDAVIGNPPWDRMKMQEVEWFAARAPAIAKQARAADRKRMIAGLKAQGDALADAYDVASSRAEKGMERARKGGDYPLLSKGDINLYSLFVERAQALIHGRGIAGLLTPSGIASDLTASAFFKSVASAGRVLSIFDFENRGVFFADVHRSFKFCTFVVGGRERRLPTTECAFFLEVPPESAPAEKLFQLTAADFALVNPNTGTAPIFRTRRDAEITTAIYRRLPVLVDRSSGTERKAWPVKYMTMFHMTNDSHLFWTRERLEKHGAYPVALGRWKKGTEEWVPLYVGRMVHHFDHRAASVTVNEENVHNAALSEVSDDLLHSDPGYSPEPQYRIGIADIDWPVSKSAQIAFRDIARSTDARTMIAALIPLAGAGNKLPLCQTNNLEADVHLLANFNSTCFDFVARNKSQSTSLNWYIVEQLPVVPPAAYARIFGQTTAAAIVKDRVLRLTYTANDMQPFARDLGYDGPPFAWDEDERRHLRARLDALYFHLYGIADEADIRYILSTFPIAERKDRAAHDGVYLTAELIVWYFRALAAGDAQGVAPEDVLIRNAKRAAAQQAV